MSAIKLDLILENLIRPREGSVFRHNYLCRNKCNVNTDYTYVGERWRSRLDIINVVHVNDSQSIYLLSIPFVKNISVGNSFDFFNRSSIRMNQPVIGLIISSLPGG